MEGHQLSTFPHRKLNYRLEEAADILSISHSHLYEELALKRIATNGEGRGRRISYAQLEAYILLREQESGWVRPKAS